MCSARTALCVVLCMCYAAGAGGASTDAYDVLEEAAAAGQAGDLGTATRLFASIVQTPALYNQLPLQHRAQVHFNYGFSVQQLGDCKAALQQYDAALKLVPELEQAYIKAAWCAKEMGAPGLAVGYLQSSLKYSKGNPSIHLHLGEMLNNLKRFDEAITVYKAGYELTRRLAGKPSGPPPNRARELMTQFLVAIGDAHVNMKNATGGMVYYAEGRRLNPSDPELTASLLHCALEACDWSNYAADVAAAISGATSAIAGGRVSTLTPYHTLFIDIDEPVRHKVIASTLGALVGSAVHANAPPGSGASAGFATDDAASFGHGILRLGYISRRFQDYPGTHLMLSMFAEHDRRRVEVHCFASGPDDSSVERQVVSRRCDSFTDVSALSDEAMAAAIKSRGIQVLVDYDGLHDFNNIRALALRPASVQATFLGFAATSSAPRARQLPSAKRGQPGKETSLPNPIDFIVADKVLAPADAEGTVLTENVWYMPHTYQPQDPRQALSVERVARVASDSGKPVHEWLSLRHQLRDREGLPQGVFAFVSFNRWSKIEPLMWTTWMNILRSAPDAVLWIYGGGSAPCHASFNASSGLTTSCSARNERDHRYRLWLEAAAQGVHPSRIIFAPRRPRDEHLARHYAADTLLDSRLYGAHTTTADGYFTGLPAVTLHATGFATNVGTSLAEAIQPGGATPGVSHSLVEYESVAVSFAQRPQHTLTLRQRIHDAISTRVSHAATEGGTHAGCATPMHACHRGLFDAAGFTRDFESRARAAFELRTLQAAGLGTASAYHIV